MEAGTRRGFLLGSMLLVLLGAPRATAGFNQFEWTFGGDPGGSGFVQDELMHLVSSATLNCTGELPGTTFFTTTAPIDATVSAHLVFDNQDTCLSFWHFEKPVYVINGQQFIIVCDDTCFDFEADFSFEVEAGDVFGFGAYSVDCWCEPGVCDYTEFEFSPFNWDDLGFSLAGTSHVAPVIQGIGMLGPNDTFQFSMKKALPDSDAIVVAAFSAFYAPFAGGVFVPNPMPPSVLLPIKVNPFGRYEFSGTWPPGVPAEQTLFFQVWVLDPGGPQGYSASNALLVVTS